MTNFAIAATMLAGCAGELAASKGSPMASPVAFTPAPVVPLTAPQEPARLIVDPPLPDQLAIGHVVVRYRTENLRIVPVFGPNALDVSPRIGHLHVTFDGAPWHWVDASGEPITIVGATPGPHTLLIELADANHHVLDRSTLEFELPRR